MQYYIDKKMLATTETPGATARRATASSGRRYKNVENGISVRDGATYDNWDYFRPEQAPPTDPREKMASSMQACERFGVVGNTVDMMSEFACQGADLVHQDVSTEKFYKEWWRKINGPSVVERQLNLLYSAGTVPVKRTWATLTASDEDLVRRGVAQDIPAGTPAGKPKKRRIPWRYTLLNPLSLEVLGGQVAPLIGQSELRYGVRVNKVLIDQLRDARKKNLFSRFNNEIDILLSQAGGGEVVPVPPEDLTVLHYKKHDWQLWATPMIFRLFRDLQTLDQLKMADMSALDGATSHVRVWRLGSLEKELYPGQAAMDKLAELLAVRSPGEVLDIIWGPDIDLLETKADGASFLGSEKYLPTWAAIFGGLGVPLSLTGVPGAGAAGTTNNWASLKTLVERLEYGRKVVTAYWEEEVRLVQRAMGFRRPAQLTFDRQSLSDEVAILRLLIELMDRNVVSREAVQERFSLIPEIEKVRTKREHKQAKKGQIPPKGGPWDDPTFESKVLMELVKQQRITPQQAGVEPTPDPTLPAGKETRATPPVPKPVPAAGPGGTKGKPGKGRPPGKKDSKPRKSPRFSPRAAKAFAVLLADLEAAGVEDAQAVATQAALDVEPSLPEGEVTPEGVRAAVVGVFGQISLTESA